MNYLGLVWYQPRISLLTEWADHRVVLRFGAVDYHAEVWINGQLAGTHSGGHLPFEVDRTDLVHLNEANLVVVQINDLLTHDTIPQGITEADYIAFHKRQNQTYPPASFDFFPYGGIPRPVKILALPSQHIADIQVSTERDGRT